VVRKWADRGEVGFMMFGARSRVPGAEGMLSWSLSGGQSTTTGAGDADLSFTFTDFGEFLGELEEIN